MNINKISVLFLTGLSLFITSCHSDYLNLEYDIKPNASQWNNDSTEIAFVIISKAYHKAKGIAEFPDGGPANFLLYRATLYSYNIESKEVKELYNFNDIIESPVRERWNAKIIFQDTFVYFKISNTDHWVKTINDSTQLDSLIEKYSNYFKINSSTNNINSVDSADFYQIYDKDDYIEVREIKKLTDEIPLKAWGLELQSIYPESDEFFIKQLIRTEKGHSNTTRRAIVEQIIANKTEAEIKDILNEMDDYKNSLKGLEKTEYKIYTKETYKRIRDLL